MVLLLAHLRLLAPSPPRDPSVDVGGLLRRHVVHLAFRQQKQERKEQNRPCVPFHRPNLVRGTHTDNIFTGSEKPYNSDYFKTLWGKYRKRSKLLQPNQTLYSFRHTGAIEIYKRTGSLTVLQQAMGHASLAVSLGLSQEPRGTDADGGGYAAFTFLIGFAERGILITLP